MFKNIFSEKLNLEQELGKLHSKFIEGGLSEEDFQIEKVLNKQYVEVLAREEIFWRKKSRETWLKEGDRNTNFIHNVVKVRRSYNKVFSI